MSENGLIEKIARLQPGRIEEVEDFVDFLLVRDSEKRPSENAVANAWLDEAEHRDSEMSSGTDAGREIREVFDLLRSRIS